MSLFAVVLLKKRVIIKEQKEKLKTRDEKTREVKVQIKGAYGRFCIRPKFSDRRSIAILIFTLTVITCYTKQSKLTTTLASV